jgi:hypothetical protein
VPESIQIHQEIAKIRERQDEQAEILNALIRFEGAELKAKLVKELQSDVSLGQILLLVDGKRTQQQIVLRLQEMGSPNANKAGVSRRIDRLANELGLIAHARRTAEGTVYRRTSLDSVLGVSRSLERL